VTDPIRALLAKADRSLKSARRSFDEADYDFAVSRAYYAMFYAAEALLFSRGLTFARHTGVIAAFNQHFVRSGDWTTRTTPRSSPRSTSATPRTTATRRRSRSRPRGR
jgi:uncharacterized protein (UPF0332 family)